jgi:rhodanese-related sulfurtransferase
MSETQFLLDNWMLIALALTSGGFLAWSSLRHTGGEGLSTLEATQLMNEKTSIVVDVQERESFAMAHLMNAKNIPFSVFKDRWPELNSHKKKAILLVCAKGNNAHKAAQLLKQHGFEKVDTLKGGLAAWQEAGLPMIK